MLRYGDDDMVATIFHELAHQLIYVKGEVTIISTFNKPSAYLYFLNLGDPIWRL